MQQTKTVIGTWIIKTLRQCGQQEDINQEMNRLNINILGVWWENNRDFVRNGHRVINPDVKKNGLILVQCM